MWTINKKKQLNTDIHQVYSSTFDPGAFTDWMEGETVEIPEDIDSPAAFRAWLFSTKPV